MKGIRLKGVLLALPAVSVVTVFFVWPMVAIVTTGLGQEPGALWRVLTDPGLAGVAWFTAWQAVVSTALTLAIGFPLAGVISRYEFPGRRALRTLVTIPFVLPTVVVALAFLTLIGPDGAIGIDLTGTVVAVLAAHVFFNLAVVVRTVGATWDHLDPALGHAAATLGASRWRAFRSVTLPLLRPAIIAAGSIVFLFSFTSFGVVLLLGAPQLTTLEVEIHRSAALLFDLPTASALALLQLVGVAGALTWHARVQARSGGIGRLLPSASIRRRPTGSERWRVTAIAVVGAAIVLLPLGTFFGRILSPARDFGLDAWRALGLIDSSIVDAPAAVANSLVFGLVAATIAVGVAVPLALVLGSRRSAMRWIDPLVMLPLGSSAVTLGFGFVIALDAPVDLRAWWGLVPIAHALIAIPLVLRMTTPVVRSIDPRLRPAAATLGASTGRAWRTIDLPILTPATAAAAALAFVVSLGEFGATLFVARPGGQTMTLAIFRLLGRPGSINLSAALAMSALLIAVTALVVTTLDRSRVPRIGRF